MITIKKLPSGYLHARGQGPCEWAQWPADRELTDEDFFPEASPEFRVELREWARRLTRAITNGGDDGR